jgi:hypothetical protein
MRGETSWRLPMLGFVRSCRYCAGHLPVVATLPRFPGQRVAVARVPFQGCTTSGTSSLRTGSWL